MGCRYRALQLARGCTSGFGGRPLSSIVIRLSEEAMKQGGFVSQSIATIPCTRRSGTRVASLHRQGLGGGEASRSAGPAASVRGTVVRVGQRIFAEARASVAHGSATYNNASQRNVIYCGRPVLAMDGVLAGAEGALCPSAELGR